MMVQAGQRSFLFSGFDNARISNGFPPELGIAPRSSINQSESTDSARVEMSRREGGVEAGKAVNFLIGTPGWVRQRGELWRLP